MVKLIQMNDRIEEAAILVLKSQDQPENVQNLFLKLIVNLINDNEDELEISVRRRDGTFRKPVIIWVVRVGDQLYVRSYMGTAGAWYRAVLANHQGYIRAGGLEKDVNLLEEPDSIINDQVDAAYRGKYHHSPYMAVMVTSDVRATTLKLVPFPTDT